jgi:hypothetical protein
MNTFELGQAVGKTIKYGAIVVAAAVIVAACTGKEETKPKAAAAPVAQVELTPEQKKQKDFEAARSTYGYLLTQLIKKSAFDEDALKIKSPEYFKNGVCVKANGKNRFGAYVGWQEYCYLVNDKGTWTYSGPN